LVKTVALDVREEASPVGKKTSARIEEHSVKKKVKKTPLGRLKRPAHLRPSEVTGVKRNKREDGIGWGTTKGARGSKGTNALQGPFVEKTKGDRTPQLGKDHKKEEKKPICIRSVVNAKNDYPPANDESSRPPDFGRRGLLRLGQRNSRHTEQGSQQRERWCWNGRKHKGGYRGRPDDPPEERKKHDGR